MPAKILKKKSGKYEVKTPNGVRAKGTTKAKAVKQQRLLNAVDHGWKPTHGVHGSLKGGIQGGVHGGLGAAKVAFNNMKKKHA